DSRAGLPAQEDVVERGECGDERELLVDRRDAGRMGVARAADVEPSSREGDLSAVRRRDARQDVDQRRLARTISPEQRVDLRGGDLQAGAVERGDPLVALDDITGVEQRLGDGAGRAFVHGVLESWERWAANGAGGAG